MPSILQTCLLQLALAFCFADLAHAQFPGQKTWCNPIDIDYKYNFEQKERGSSFRSVADPVIVNHKVRLI